MGVRVQAVAVVGFFFVAEGAALFTTVDAGVVEGRVVRPEGTFTAVPEGHHCSGNVER